MTVAAPPEITIRPILPEDAPKLAEIMAAPSVARWWGEFDEARIERELIVGEPDVRVYAIELDGRLIGAIQSAEETDEEFRHAGIDLFLDDEIQGNGIGPAAIRLLARRLIDEDGHHRITIDPAADNEHAIRAYEKVGFRVVGRLRRYQRMADGTWVDGMLMELLADELID
jgi:aminoglycoside 6'-N-acetyltransferase